MYKNVFCENRGKDKNPIIHIWEDNDIIGENSKLPGYDFFEYEPTGYVLDSKGKERTIYGQPCTKIFGKEALNKALAEGKTLYESDLSPEQKTLIDIYYESDEVATGHKIMFLDIEVESRNGYSEPKDAENEITTIGFLMDNIHYTLLLDKTKRIKNRKTEKGYLRVFDTEDGLLFFFRDAVKKLRPDIIIGWNSDEYDFPYLFNRCVIRFSKKWVKDFSPIGIVSRDNQGYWTIAGVTLFDMMILYKTYTPNEESSYSLDNISKKLLGRGKVKYEGTLDDLLEKDPDKFIEYNIEDNQLVYDINKQTDFIDLAISVAHGGFLPYDQFYLTSAVEDGAAIVFCKRNGNLVVPNRKKRQKLVLQQSINEGSLQIDVQENIDNDYPKSGRLIFQLSKSKTVECEYIRYEDKSFILEEPIDEYIPYFAEVKIGLSGAFVKPPIRGLHLWVFDNDMTGLYPSNIRSANISPETKRGRVINFSAIEFVKPIKDRKEYNVFLFESNEEITFYSIKDLREFIEENNYNIASNGVLYTKEQTGIIPSILSYWADLRNEFKNKMKAAVKAGDKKLEQYYNIRQWRVKIQANAFYGVLALPSFRFYDVDNAEAITTMGKQIIQFVLKVVNIYFNNQLNTQKVDYVITVDTDSQISSSLPLIINRFPEVISQIKLPDNIPIYLLQYFESKKIEIPKVIENTYDKQFMIEQSIKIAVEIQDYINSFFDKYAKTFHNIDNHVFNIKQEWVGDSSLFVAKKRYIIRLVNKEGNNCNKLEIKGIDIVRSNFPKLFKEFMQTFLINILNIHTKDELDKSIIELRKRLDNKEYELMDILCPSSVKELDKFNPDYRQIFKAISGTTAQAKAALFYNDILIKNKLPNERIKNGFKVRWTYLKGNPLKIFGLAIKGYNDPDYIIDYLNTYIDNDMNYDKQLSKKLMNFYECLGYDKLPEKQIYEDSIFDF